MLSRDKLIQLILLVFATDNTIFAPVQTLECGILYNDISRNFSQVIANCLIRTLPPVADKRENITRAPNATNEDDQEEYLAYGPRRGLRLQRETKLSTNTSLGPKTIHSSSSTNTTESVTCVVHCILTAFNIIGSKGFPENRKIVPVILPANANQILRDLLQDIVDECFMQLSDASEVDACTYSARLVTCLAEKGKFNCSDWPVGELSFPHKF